MAKRILCALCAMTLLGCIGGAAGEAKRAELMFQGHGSLRVITPEGKVIYIDPYAGTGYELQADLILVTHNHSDHNAVSLIKNRSEDCQIITWKEGLADGAYQTFELGYVTVEAVQAGNNKNHSLKSCVGFVLTFSDGITLYISGDTSTTEQMTELGSRKLDYAFFCCDGTYNMDISEAAACAATVGAKHSVPYHMAPGKLFDPKRAEQFQAENRLIIPAGESIALE